MTPRFRTAARTAIAAAGLLATPTLAGEVASAGSGAESTIFLTATVPVLCNVELMPTTLHYGSGVVALGQSIELCNAPRGYRVILQHPGGLTNAALISDTQRIPLSASGETVLVNSDHPSLEVRQLALDLGSEPNQINQLGIRIEVNY